MVRKKKAKNVFKCIVCKAAYSSKGSLRVHAKKHIRAFEEIKLLEQGYTPEETKVGTKFRGKNRVIIS